MSTATPEKNNSFEAQINEQLGSLDLSSDVLEEASLETGRVSEIVGENAGENIPQAKKTKKKGLKIISHQVAGLLAGGGKATAKHHKLPAPVVQRKKVRKALEKRTRKLVAEATKIQNSKNFSASRLEEVLLEIRHLREILADLLQSTVDRIEDLYRRYVIGTK